MMDDFAVVIGLQNYPGLDDIGNGQMPLCGPENDARNFNEWLLSPNGGDVPPTNIKMILSSDYPPEVDISLARPGFQEVKNVFHRLRKLSLAKEAKGQDPKIGRRLYIYMSGHGIAPKIYADRSDRDAGLLMCNVDMASITDNTSHIPGGCLANWFCESSCFEQVFLFMDCCRDQMMFAAPNILFAPHGIEDEAIRCYFYATKCSRRAKEIKIDGETQGVFTRTLLLGLMGAAADPDPNNPNIGIITIASLKSYLYQNMKQFMASQFKNEVESQEPEVVCYPNDNEGRDIVIKTTALEKFPVIIDISKGGKGNFSIERGVIEPAIQEITVVSSPLTWTVELPRGTYRVSGVINGKLRKEVFKVTGVERKGSEVKVNL